MYYCQDCWTNLLTCCKYVLVQNPKAFIQGSQHTTRNPKVKIPILPHPRSNSKLEPMFPTYKRQFPKVRKQISPTLHFFWYWECWLQKKHLLVLPHVFLSKETRYWLLQALGGTQYICMNADYKIYGNVWMRNTRILYIHVAGSRFPPRTVMISPSRIGS